MGGSSDSALIHVASGDTLIGIHGIPPPNRSNTAASGLLLGSADQIEGGNGISWTRGKSTSAPQNRSSHRNGRFLPTVADRRSTSRQSDTNKSGSARNWRMP